MLKARNNYIPYCKMFSNDVYYSEAETMYVPKTSFTFYLNKQLK